MPQLLTLICSNLLLLFPWMLVFGSAGMDIILSGIALCFLLFSYQTQQWDWLKAPWVRCMGVAWIYMVSRGALADHPSDALRHGAPFIRFFVFAAALAYWLMRSPDLQRKFMLSLTAMLLFVTGDALLQWMHGREIMGYETLVDASGHFRLTGPFGATKPIVGIVLVWLAFPVVLHWFFGSGAVPAKRKILSLAFAFVMLVTVALTGERLALMLALLGCALVVLALRLNLRLLLGGALALMVLLFGMAITIPSFFDRQINSTIETFAHWQETPYGKLFASDIRLVAASPVFGLGPNQFRTACPALYPGQSEEYIKTVCNLHPHNIYLEWMIDAGVIGLGLFLAFLFIVARLAWQNWKLNGFNPLLLGWALALFLRAWPLASTTGFFSSWGAPPFWLLVGMTLAHALPAQKERTS